MVAVALRLSSRVLFSIGDYECTHVFSAVERQLIASILL